MFNVYVGITLVFQSETFGEAAVYMTKLLRKGEEAHIEYMDVASWDDSRD